MYQLKSIPIENKPIRNSKNQETDHLFQLCKKHKIQCIGANLNPSTKIDEVLVCAICLQEDQHKIQFVTLQEAQRRVDQMYENFENQKYHQIDFKRNTLYKLIYEISKYQQYSNYTLQKLMQICSDLIQKLEEKLTIPIQMMSFSENIKNLSKQEKDLHQQDSIFNFYTQFMNLADLTSIENEQKKYFETIQKILIDISKNSKQNIGLKEATQKIELKCLRHKDQYIQMLDLNPKIDLKNRLLCPECPPSNHTSLNKSQVLWQALLERKKLRLDEYLQELNDGRVKANTQLREFRNSVLEISNSISQYLNDSYFKALWEVGQMKDNMQKQLQVITHQELEGIAEILSSEQKQCQLFSDWINQHKTASLKQFKTKISLHFSTLFQHFSKCFKTFKHNFFNDYQEIMKKNIQPMFYQDFYPSSVVQGNLIKPIVNYKMESASYEKKKVYSMVFNQTQDIFIASSGEIITVYDFKESQFQYRQKLSFQNQKFINLFYSEEAEVFYSGSQEGLIVQWQLNKENQFIEINLIYGHKLEEIRGLISLNADTQIIVASDSLTIWRAIKEQNKWELDYSLNKHEDGIMKICIDSSKNQLLSCGFDKKIIIWQKGEDNIFKYKQIIETKELNQSICFIDDQCFVCQSFVENTLYFYGMDQQQLFVLKDLNLPLRVQTQQNEHIKYSAAKGLLVSLNGQFITIFSKGEDYNFRINQFIELREANIVVFTLTADGKYLVTWDDASMNFLSRSNE